MRDLILPTIIIACSAACGGTFAAVYLSIKRQLARPSFTMKVDHIARIAHEANRAYCITRGDLSKKAWQNEDPLVRTCTREGVRYRLAHPNATPEQMHESWCKTKRAQGYRHGATVCHRSKTHPCLVAYDQLPPEQRFKDHLFSAIVGLVAAGA